MSEERTSIVNVIVIGAAVTLGLVVAVWMLLPRPGAQSVADLYRQAEQQLQAGNFLGAEANLREAAAKAPDDARVHFALGQALAGLNQPEQAQSSFQAAAKLSPSRDLLYQSGVALLQSHSEKAAAEFFGKLLKQFPQDLPALYQLGAIQSRQGHYDEAAKTFEALVTFSPNEAEAWNNLGFCYHNLGRTLEARQAIAKALAIKPDFAQAKANLEIILRESETSPLPGK